MKTNEKKPVRFGKIRQGQYFRRFANGELMVVVWKRLKGTWAIPLYAVGEGCAGWHINRKEIVQPVDNSLTEKL